MGNKIIHLALVLIFLISFTSIANAGKETMIMDSRLITGVSIYGDIVTWAENFGPSANMYNLTTGNVTWLGHARTCPSIQGDKVTWCDEENVVVRNISTGKEVEIINANTPAIYGDNLVYVRSKYADGQPAHYQHAAEYNSLYLYNLSTNEETQLTPYEHAHFYSSIYENKIVWGRANQVNSGEWSRNISIYDIPTKRVSDISRTGTAVGGKIYGNIVAWVELKNESWDIYMRDIAKHETHQVTFDGNSTSPDVYGDRIVWLRYRAGNNCSNGIYMYNVSTNETTHITYYIDSPTIYDDKIVYTGPSNDTGDPADKCIYLYNLSA